MARDTSKYTNHTKEEVEDYLKVVKKSIKSDEFIVVQLRKMKRTGNLLNNIS